MTRATWGRRLVLWSVAFLEGSVFGLAVFLWWRG